MSTFKRLAPWSLLTLAAAWSRPADACNTLYWEHTGMISNRVSVGEVQNKVVANLEYMANVTKGLMRHKDVSDGDMNGAGRNDGIKSTALSFYGAPDRTRGDAEIRFINRNIVGPNPDGTWRVGETAPGSGVAVVFADQINEYCRKYNLNMGDCSAFTKAAVLHELGHAVGMTIHATRPEMIMSLGFTGSSMYWEADEQSMLRNYFKPCPTPICTPGTSCIGIPPGGGTPMLDVGAGRPPMLVRDFLYSSVAPDWRVPGNPSYLTNWGFDYGSPYIFVDPTGSHGTTPPNFYNTYIYTQSPGGGNAVSEAVITIPNGPLQRNADGASVYWSMKFPSNLGIYVKSTNLFAIALLNQQGQTRYAFEFWPTGLYDPWTGKDFQLDKNVNTNPSVIASGLTSTDTPTDRWIHFRMSVDKTRAAGGSGTVSVCRDIADGAGWSHCVSAIDEEHTEFYKVYLGYLTGTGSANASVRIDDISVRRGSW